MLKLMLEIEDARTRIAYLLPAGRSPLEVLRNYQDVVKAAGGEVLYACKSEECGGDPERSVLIVGHTDNQGAYDYNLDLSRRRAEAVVKALTSAD